MKQVREFLDNPIWPESLDSHIPYRRQHDDTDGEPTGFLQVYFDMMGDAYVSIDESKWLRFRTSGGGGASLRTRAALVVLAEAIRLDNGRASPSQCRKRHDNRMNDENPIEQLNFLAQAAAARANEGDMGNALTLIRQIAQQTDALLHSDLTAQSAAIAELQRHREALERFYDN